MAVPKKRTSVSRKGLRRGGQHHRLTPKITQSCSNCGSVVLAHRACPSCGFYKGRAAMAVKAATEKHDHDHDHDHKHDHKHDHDHNHEHK